MPQCGVMGQAAGVAAVMSIRRGVFPKNVKVEELQAELKAQGCIVDAGDIGRENA
jgi:hypothetical protein